VRDAKVVEGGGAALRICDHVVDVHVDWLDFAAADSADVTVASDHGVSQVFCDDSSGGIRFSGFMCG